MATNSVLNEPVLVLNRSWQYIGMTTARDAVADLYAGVLTAVCPETFATYTFDDWAERGIRPGTKTMRSPHLEIEVPEVVVLSNYDKVPNRSLHYSKGHIFKRDRYTCCYCGAQPGHGRLTIDHVTPRSQGGFTDWHNCVTACEPCNGKKADRTPDQAGMRLRTVPMKPQWTVDQAVHRVAEELKPSWKHFVKSSTGDQRK